MNKHEAIIFMHIDMSTHKHIHRHMYKYMTTDILTRLPILISQTCPYSYTYMCALAYNYAHAKSTYIQTHVFIYTYLYIQIVIYTYIHKEAKTCAPPSTTHIITITTKINEIK